MSKRLGKNQIRFDITNNLKNFEPHFNNLAVLSEAKPEHKYALLIALR